ncbi:hypothetical protein GF371_04745, partial [Candidatus Woesearchaeota archaeon]|nr:hypothetical protein [Candidatus Woesearchaeota archaeon]
MAKKARRQNGKRNGKGSVYVEKRNGHTLTFDLDRAYEVFTIGVRARDERTGVFAYDYLYPEALLPSFIEPKSQENAMYWFLSVFWDYNTNSARLYRDYYFLVSFYPEILDAKQLRERGPVRNRNLFKKFLSHPNAKPGAIYLDSALETLIEEYDGNPLNIVNDIEDINEARDRIVKFKNFQEKKANLLLLYYVKYGLTTFSNPYEHCVAVDIHKVRVPANLMVMDVQPRASISDKTGIEFANNAFKVLLKAHPDLNASKVDDLLWVVGAKLCVKELKGKKNNPKWSRCLTDCPVEPYCGRVIGADYGKTFDFDVDQKPDSGVLFGSGSLAIPTHEEKRGKWYED